MSQKVLAIGVCFCVSILSFNLVSCSQKPTEEKPAIQVNEYAVSAEEFNERFREMCPDNMTPGDKAVFLENFLDQKVLLYEAQRLGIDKEPEFLDAIERFWEQSLVKIVVDRKYTEIAQTVNVSDE